jgi:two-component system, chemotaxis family, protein-glutamate methylesterase/glutaminase
MIVIGGSLGSCEVLECILRGLPASFRLPIAVAFHRHRRSEGLLTPVLQRASVLPVSEVEDKTPWEPGHVYVCPPDYHLMLDDGCFSLSVDELVNFARPSIDVLFESAADGYGSKAIAVTLSGSGSDGAAGAKKIRDAGGLVIVQDPKTAEAHWMPAAVVAATKTRHLIPAEKIAPALVRLARWRTRTTPSFSDRS